jgi:hypothetical protein
MTTYTWVSTISVRFLEHVGRKDARRAMNILYAEDIPDLIASSLIGDVLSTGVEGVSMGSNRAKNSGYVQRQPVLELGWVRYGREVVLYGRVEPAVADELRTLVSEVIQRPNAELDAMQPSKMFGLLIVAAENLISVEPGVATVGPDESNDATGPASAMVGWGRKDFLSLVRRLVGCPKSGPPSKDELIPANRTLVFN